MTLFEVRMSPNVTSQWREGGTDTPVDNDADDDGDDDGDEYVAKRDIKGGKEI